MSAHLLKSWITHATPKSRNIVRSVLLANPDLLGMTSQDIYNAALQQFPNESVDAPPPNELSPGQKGRFGRPPQPVPDPPNRNHPLRSVKYLKKIVLEDLVARGEIEKIRIKRGAGGTDKDGEPLDLIAGRGVSKTAAKTGIIAKEVWLWRLKRIPVKINPHTLEKTWATFQPKLEEDAGEEVFLLSPEGWTKKNLRFVNVPRVRANIYSRPSLIYTDGNEITTLIHQRVRALPFPQIIA